MITGGMAVLKVKHKSHRWGRSIRVHPERFGIAYIRCADPEVSELIPLQGVTFEQVIDRVSESLEKSGVSRNEFEFIISK